MNGTFNGQILVEKLVKLNISQQSIETLSHWCIFHRTNARQVVETWNEQFHCSPREQRLSFLYLANHILQTSRQKGSEFVGEFWKVLPDALSDVIENGDEFGRNAALRMINIWEERKVFGSGGKILKEQVMGRNMVNSSRNGKYTNIKPKQSVGNILEKIISSYDAVYDGCVDEEALLSKCKTAVVYVDKVDKEIGGDYSSGKLDGSEFAELQGQHGILRKCIEQLRAAESSRATLVSQIKEALEEQELKLGQVRTQLQAARAQSEQAEKICQQLLNSNEERLVSEHGSKEIITFSDMPSSFTPETQAASGEEQSVPVMYTPRALSLPNNSSSIVEEDSRKSAAAAVAAKLAASTSSAQMLTFVLSSLASENMIGSQLNESPGGDHPAEKRAKIENGPTSYAQQPQHSQPPPPHFPHPESLQNVTTTSQPLTQLQPPLLPSSSSSPMPNPGPTVQQPPLTSVPPPPAQFMQTAGSMTSVPYSYGLAQQRPPPSLPSFSVTGPPPPPLPSFSVTGPPPPTTGMSPFSSPNPYQNFQGSEGGFYSHSSLPASPAVSRDLHLSS